MQTTITDAQRIQARHPRDPQHLLEQLLEQLRAFPVDLYHRGTQSETAVLDACALLDDDALRELATAEYPAAAAARYARIFGDKAHTLHLGLPHERVEKLQLLDKARAYYTISLALREAFPPAPEAVRCLDKLGPLEANTLHILAMREGGEPVAVRTEALAQLSKLELIRVDVDGRPFPLELTPLGLEVWALRQPGSPVNRYEVERARIRQLVEASGGRLVTTAEQTQLPTHYRRLGPPPPCPMCDVEQANLTVTVHEGRREPEK